MEQVYSNYFVGEVDSLKIGRKVYESIMSNTYSNLCPYCSHRDVKTIDHFLPKSKFSSLVIVPANLVPCCSDCNKDKSDDFKLTDDKMLIHPYFDDISNLNWLKCTVNEDVWPITFSYTVSNDISNSKLKSRIKQQFNLLNLNKLYADNATREFNKRVKIIIKEFASNPESKAFDFIEENIDSYRSENENSWQTKMFVALKESSWFIDEALPKLQEYYKK